VRFLQAAEDVQRLMRAQGFELYDANPRMLPREFTPRKLLAAVAAASPGPQQPEAGARSGDAGGSLRGRRGGGRGSGRAGGRGRKGAALPGGVAPSEFRLCTCTCMSEAHDCFAD
jgi:hypothetical protein